mgnify:CR=1 FL=1
MIKMEKIHFCHVLLEIEEKLERRQIEFENQKNDFDNQMKLMLEQNTEQQVEFTKQKGRLGKQHK